MYYCIELAHLFNNKGITNLNDGEKGSLDEFARLSLPKHFFKDMMYLRNIPFQIGISNDYDNFSISQKTEILFPKNIYTDIYFLGACNNGNFFNKLTFFEGEKFVLEEKLLLTDLMEDFSYYRNEKFAEYPYMHSPKGTMNIKSALWVHHIKFEKPIILDSLVLEENPFIHIFSITLGVSN